MEIISFISATFIYLVLNAYIYYVLDIKQMVYASLDYKPWTCRTCLTFWLSVWISTVAALAGDYIFAITLAVISSLDAIAKLIDEKQKYGSNND